MTQVHTFECPECGWTEHSVSSRAADQIRQHCPVCGAKMDHTSVES